MLVCPIGEYPNSRASRVFLSLCCLLLFMISFRNSRLPLLKLLKLKGCNIGPFDKYTSAYEDVFVASKN